ncbi:MAG: DivIVA domain-containing protein [Clostridia bacterium]|nr:DivIVA domain-containing protein [Clostridia bacterium]
MLAPQELKNKDFSKALRGYNPQEVDEYIEFLLEKYTEAYRENSELERKLHSVIAMLDQIKDDEESIRSTLVNAQKAGEKIIRDANERADAIVNGIKERCDEVIKQFKTEANEEVNNIWRIRTSIIEFKQKLYTLYSGHLEDLQGISVNELTDIIVPDTGKVVNGIVSDVTSQFKRDLEEKTDADADTDDEDDGEDTAAAASGEGNNGTEDQSGAPEGSGEGGNDGSGGGSTSGDTDDIDDFIKFFEDKADE